MMNQFKQALSQKFFCYNDLSSYRAELMGWAIIWIMMLHFTFHQVSVLGFVSQYGYAGVDIFMLVSGFGLFHSLEKDSRLTAFYSKRILRIFPTYYILGGFACLFLFHDSIITYLFRCSTIGFWTGGPYWEWYIPSIIAFYWVAPFLKKLIDQKRWFLIGMLVSVIMLLSYIVIARELVEAKNPHFFMLYRFPAFMFGMLCAYWMKKGISMRVFWFILLVGLPCFVMLFPHHHEIYNYKYLSLLFLLPMFTVCFIFISKQFGIFNPLIAHIGKASLEVYLIQNIFFNAIIDGRISIPSTWHDAITLALIVVSSLLGIFSHWVIEKGSSRLRS